MSKVSESVSIKVYVIMTTLETLPKIADLAARGALFVVNHSGGKDSQAMFHVVRRLVPRDQVLVVHADLPEVDWPGTLEHVQATTSGFELVVAHGTKTFFQMVEHRGRWPSPQRRQCTSDLKRTPIDREIRRYLKRNPRFGGLVINCMGLRAEESASRAKADTLKLSARNSKAGREWYDWLPIHALLVGEVFRIIAGAGQKPHWAYGAGMTRLSCCFCIMASRQDLATAARLNPELYRRYCVTERRLGQTFLMPTKSRGRQTLEDVTGIPATACRPALAA